MFNRRALYKWSAVALGNALALAVAVPGSKYLLDPLGKKSEVGSFHPMTRLSQLKVGEPEAFAEPVGSVWLVRQEDGAEAKVLAFSAECPHLSCPVNLAPDRGTFLCPCHQASFRFDGQTLNAVSPRGMDALEVRLSDDADPEIAVKFERFVPQSREKKPLV